jgi:hypothetical protein
VGFVVLGVIFAGVIAGVGVYVTVTLTMCGVGVASSVAFVDPGLVHPLINSIPIIKNVRIPMIRRFLIFTSLHLSAKYLYNYLRVW